MKKNLEHLIEHLVWFENLFEVELVVVGEWLVVYVVVVADLVVGLESEADVTPCLFCLF